MEQRGLWLAATYDGMVDLKGLLDPEAGEAVRSALAPLARPTGPEDGRTAAQRRADAIGDLGRRALQAGDLPEEGGLRPNVNVTIDLASLQNPHSVGGVGCWGGVLPSETVRRLACDAVVTRAVVRRDPIPAHASHASHAGGPGHDHGGATCGHLADPALGISLDGSRPWRDGDHGGLAEGGDRPPQWTDAHHVVHWVDGGPTSLDNLVLLCRTHHVAVHELGWQPHRDPASGRVTLTPPSRGHDPPAA